MKESLVHKMLEEIGDNPDRIGLKDTPQRVHRMWKDFFTYGQDPPVITCFPNNEDGVVSGGLLLDRGYFYSYCEHHLLPFFGQYFYGYIPDRLVMGASKIARTIDYYSGRLQVAERLCRQVVDRIQERANPQGQILLMSGRHLCKEMRGVKKYNSTFEVIEARGIILSNKAGCKDEFLARCQI